MAINDHVSNLLTRIRNAQTARFEQVELPCNRVIESITQILKEEGFVKGYKIFRDQKQPVIRITLRQVPEAGYAIKGIRRVSRPSRRVYVGKDDVPTVKSGFGVAILSTSQGVMTGARAKKLSIGGELLCEVW